MSGAFTWHGGRLSDAVARFGGAAADWLDLSTGINPCPWPGHAAIAPRWDVLPDPPDLLRLEQAAADHFGVDPACCAAVPGSEAALRLIAALLDLPGRPVVPGYRTHADAFGPATPARVGEAPGAEPQAFILANPNNPDGQLHPPEALRDWAERIAHAGGWLVVDEAYADTVPQYSLAPALAHHPRLVLLRSFGKVFGLPGVRLGFVLAAPALLMRLRRLLGEWPVGASAIAFGTPAYRDAGWIAQTRTALHRRALLFDSLLLGHGLAPRGACPLFRLVETPDAEALFHRLARHRILTRPFAENPRWLRLGVPQDHMLERVERALAGG
jgi:cobalamin biosynthetic protein CobC